MRILFVANRDYLFAQTDLTLTVTFATDNGDVTYTAILSGDSDDFVLYERVSALGQPYSAENGCLIFGVVIVGIPQDSVDSATVILSNTADTVLVQGTADLSE